MYFEILLWHEQILKSTTNGTTRATKHENFFSAREGSKKERNSCRGHGYGHTGAGRLELAHLSNDVVLNFI